MNILVIGSGGREHALAWKLSQSAGVKQVFAAPGNPGIESVATCVPIEADNIPELLKFAWEHAIDLTVVGPEAPLVDGIVNTFREHDLRVFGPDRNAAQLEGSKAFSKDFMMKYDIPTALYGEYTEWEEAREHLSDYGFPVVLKADGLAAGKGVLICGTLEEAEEGLKEIMVDRKFGDSGSKVVIEEFLTGIEASVLCLVDGKTIVPLESARDYKRALDGDEGLNTGGMGTCSPNPDYTDAIAQEVEEKVLKPFLKGVNAEGMDYRGLVFIGIMMTPNGVKVLEFNVRFGDPETQSVLMRLESDLAQVLTAVCEGKLSEVQLQWSPQTAVTFVLASPGYPETSVKGIPIMGLDAVKAGQVFHAGTSRKDGQVVTAGGRVLNLSALGNSYEDARAVCLGNARTVVFDGMQYRTDIAKF